MINERPVDKINNNYFGIFIAPRFIQMKSGGSQIRLFQGDRNVTALAERMT